MLLLCFRILPIFIQKALRDTAVRACAQRTKAVPAGDRRTVVGCVEQHRRVGSYDLQRNSFEKDFTTFLIRSC
jgi:hypothetical protein